MQLALPNARLGVERRIAAAARSCRRSTRSTYRLFTAIWMIAFALALVGPLAGFYDRYNERGNN